MNERRKAASFLIRVWQEPSQWQPPGEWRVSAHPLEGGGEVLFNSANELWRYLTHADSQIQSTPQTKKIISEGEENEQ